MLIFTCIQDKYMQVRKSIYRYVQQNTCKVKIIYKYIHKEKNMYKSHKYLQKQIFTKSKPKSITNKYIHKEKNTNRYKIYHWGGESGCASWRSEHRLVPDPRLPHLKAPNVRPWRPGRWIRLRCPAHGSQVVPWPPSLPKVCAYSERSRLPIS